MRAHIYNIYKLVAAIPVMAYHKQLAKNNTSTVIIPTTMPNICIIKGKESKPTPPAALVRFTLLVINPACFLGICKGSIVVTTISGEGADQPCRLKLSF